MVVVLTTTAMMMITIMVMALMTETVMILMMTNYNVSNSNLLEDFSALEDGPEMSYNEY